jgi:arylsulfatase A-like enzyme
MGSLGGQVQRHTLHYGYTLIENGTPVAYGSDPEDYQMDVLVAKAVDFIETTPSTTPFFLYFAPQSPHGPLVPAPRHRNAFRGIPDFRTPAVNEADVSDKPACIRALPLRSESQMDRLDDHRRKQMELLLAVDEGVEVVLDALEAEGFLEETIVVYMTDNGFAFGEYRWNYKKCAYTACTRSPMFFRCRVPGPARRDVSCPTWTWPAPSRPTRARSRTSPRTAAASSRSSPARPRPRGARPY